MAEECEFYFYDSDYCCRLLKNSDKEYVLDSDWVHRYCWGYHYDACPYYQNKSDMGSSSGGCFLSSACVIAKNLPDNCRELEVLRSFRDEFMLSLKSGPDDIKHYYSTAPKIVDAINRSEDATATWSRIYNELVAKCVGLIDAGQYTQAYDFYKYYFKRLEEQYQ